MGSSKEVKAKVTADTTGFEKGMDTASQKLKTFGTEADRNSKKASAGMNSSAISAQVLKKGLIVAGSAAVVAGTALAAFAIKGISTNDAQIKLAKQMGMTNIEFQTMSKVAEFAGTSIQELRVGFKRLADTIYDAVENGGKSAEAFEKIGISAKDLIDLSPEEQLKKIGEGMQFVSNRTERAALASDIFGKNGMTMLPILDDMENLLNRAGNEAKNFGVTLSDVDSRPIEAVNDNFSSLKTAITGVSTQLIASMAPAMLRITNKMVEYAGRTAKAIKETNELDRAVKRLGTTEEQETDKVTVLQARVNKLTELKIKMIKSGAEAGTYGPEARAAVQKQLEDAQALLDIENEIQQKRLNADADTKALSGREAKLAADKKAQAEADAKALEEWLARVTEAYAQTTDAKKIALDAEIAWFKNAQTEADKTKGLFPPIIAMLQEQRDALDENAGTDFYTERLNTIRESLLTEEEILANNLEEKRITVQEAYEAEEISAQEHNEIMLALDKQYVDQSAEIRERGLSAIERFNALSWHQQGTTVAGELAGLTQTLDSSNKKQFKIMKVGAIATAIVNTYKGISQSLANYPMPLAGVMAAAHAAAGWMQVNNIRKQEFTSAGSGGGYAAPASPVAATATQGNGGSSGSMVTINLQGQTYQKQDVVALINEINEAVGDGSKIRIA
jgi:hypothetical protein